MTQLKLQGEPGKDVLSEGQTQPRQVQLRVPERPVLAPNVQLIGEMQETGFRDRQWLIQRNGRFMQVTELLYRVAEQVDGERTLEEIARGVTEATEWAVTAADVRRLILTRLIPLGLVLAEGGLLVTANQAASPAVPRSPLAVNMRLRLLGQRSIDPIARMLQVLFWPGILVPILIAAVAAHWWLYGVHGILGSVSDALATPGGLLLALVIVLVGGIFHEFGHAAALRYGGGVVRGMGAGLYLVYPVFYTDVTDSYRLGRWGRVRTDLGGVYFHLIFALALILASVGTGSELLLFPVLLISLQIISQFIPFARFDGYWMLADLTGIPDLFSQMAPFLRSIFSRRGVAGSRLPNLKPWVKAVFTAYIVITIPLLAFFLYRLVRRLPTFLARTWDSLALQTELLSLSYKSGDLLTATLSVTQLFLLLLPVAGTVYILYSASHGLTRVIWSWSRPTPARRLAGALAGSAVVGVVGLLWAPQWHRLVERRPVLQQVSRVDGLLGQSRKAVAALETLQADLEGAVGSERFRGTLLLKRPGQARVAMKGGEEFGQFQLVSDGNTLYRYFPGDNRVGRSIPGRDGRNIQTFVAEPVDLFFQPQRIGAVPKGGLSTYEGKRTVDGTEYEVVKVTSSSTAARKKTTHYFISPRDHLVHRVTTTTERAGDRSITWAQLKNVRINAPMDDSVFLWKPPASAGPLQMPEGFSLPLGQGATR